MLDPNHFFSPSQAIRDENVHMFSGRVPQFEAGLEGISQEGSALAIFGQRGVGKTSFAWNLRRILDKRSLAGSPYPDSDLLKSRLPKKKYDTVWLQCRRDHVGVLGVLVALMKGGTGADTTLRDLDSNGSIFGETELKSIERVAELNLKVAKLTSRTKKAPTKHAEDQTSELVDAHSQGHSIFFETLARVKRKRKKPILIFLDEFDSLRDSSGFGSLIKSCNDARFVIAGVAESSTSLRRDHRSVGRKLIDVQVPVLSPGELDQLFDSAERRSIDMEQRLMFSSEYRNSCYEMTGGYPHLVHQIGYETVKVLREDVENEQLTADAEVLSTVDSNLYGEAGNDREYATIKEAVGDSNKREKILFALASLQHGWAGKEQVKDILTAKNQKGYYNHLKVLKDRNLLEVDASGDNVRFREPIHRMLVRNADAHGRNLAD